MILQEATRSRVCRSPGARRAKSCATSRWADWSPDGQSLLIVRQAGSKHRIEFPAGKVLYQTDNLIPEARLSRDGRQRGVLRKDRPAPTITSASTWWTSTAPGGRSSRNGSTDWGWCGRPDGKEIWFSGSDGSDVPPIRAVDMSGKMRTIFGMTVAAAITDVLPGGRRCSPASPGARP